jgi:hypothetical protein
MVKVTTRRESVYFDGVKIVEFDDATFVKSGHAGLGPWPTNAVRQRRWFSMLAFRPGRERYEELASRGGAD